MTIFAAVHESGVGPTLPTCAVQEVGSFLATPGAPATRSAWSPLALTDSTEVRACTQQPRNWFYC